MLQLLFVIASTFAMRSAVADPRDTLRERNPQHVAAVDVDRAGRIRHVRTDDPALAGDDEALRGWLQQNADLLGGRAEDEARRAGDVVAYYLIDPERDTITGAAIVHHTRGAADVRIVPATHSPDDEVTALAGTRHVQIARYGELPGRDCRMGNPRRACTPRVTATRRRSVVLAAEEVAATLQLRVIGGAVRLVVCVEADAPPPDDERTLISTSVVGFPFAIDAATGAAVRVTSCVPEL